MPAPIEEQLGNALRVDVPEDAKESVKLRVMEQVDLLIAAKPSPEPKAPRRPWDILKLRLVALVSSMVVILGAGTTVAAAAAGPDSWLYPVKQDLEVLRADMARGSLAEAQYQVDRAGKRLDEIDGMMAAGKPQYIPDLLAHYAAHMQRATELRNEAAANGENTAPLDESLAATSSRHDELLKSLNGELPDDVRQAVIGAGEGEAMEGDAPGTEESGAVCPLPASGNPDQNANGNQDTENESQAGNMQSWPENSNGNGDAGEGGTSSDHETGSGSWQPPGASDDDDQSDQHQSDSHNSPGDSHQSEADGGGDQPHESALRSAPPAQHQN